MFKFEFDVDIEIENKEFSSFLENLYLILNQNN